ncbi:hypothetical protein DM02DRAFT_609507 [Periconia macrospinosa]|uniref:NIMA interactive protein n=1 Tax=Periconia macrospinosa TaxID=97972 RepID=A0A2V1EBS5_9PLEO|nr:hypothetical protein DM02DRAFT_609507 [Periconia macrospinosa]
MESYNLKTASTYINNLLLARGLLRDGKSIEFAHPSRGAGGKEVTMAQIINLVHDLILKRDRDQEHREAVAGTLRTARSEATRLTLTIEKLQTRNDDLSRQISLAQSQERSARAALRTAESTARSLREEMVRLKATVQQVRTSCANDIRKRDVQIQRLKSHLTSQQRGNRTGVIGASITINPGVMGVGGIANGAKDEAPDVDDPEYSLKQETTEFLTQLSQSLSDENDNLIGLVRTTINTLKELQGMPEGPRQHGEDLSTIGEEDEMMRQSMLQALPTNYETLANDLDTVLDNLKNLLTNPNFVPLEEVESREEEILRLRAGWEKMEMRLREAFAMMDTWRKRMASGGDTINLEELKLGLGLGVGLETINNEDISILSDEEQEDDDLSSVFDEEPDLIERLPSPEADEVPEKAGGSDLFSVKLQPKNPLALRESNGNTQSPTRSPRKVAFSASVPNTPEIENAQASGLDLVGEEKSTQSTPSSHERSSRATSRDERTPRHVRCDNIADQIIKLASDVNFPFSPPTFQMPITSGSNDDLQTKKRLSSPHAHPEEPSPKLTVQDKLKAAQVEAEAAAAAEGVKTKASQSKSNQDGSEEVGHERRQRRPSRSSPKKTRITGRPKRRKSTLTPEELDTLLLSR